VFGLQLLSFDVTIYLVTVAYPWGRILLHINTPLLNCVYVVNNLAYMIVNQKADFEVQILILLVVLSLACCTHRHSTVQYGRDVHVT
jgi:hypothetical protein